MDIKVDFKAQLDATIATHNRFIKELDKHVDNGDADKAVLAVFGILEIEEKYDSMTNRWQRILGVPKLTKLITIIPKYATW